MGFMRQSNNGLMSYLKHYVFNTISSNSISCNHAIKNFRPRLYISVVNESLKQNSVHVVVKEHLWEGYRAHN